ncbi:hypothetical protein LTR85_008998 [Meristemomyces frigidus]|nr:hypothetical protein LTR85_008998 [Meristemomyces frigidus]
MQNREVPSSAMDSVSNQSRLLLLPAELRVHILGYALPSGQEYTSDSPRETGFQEPMLLQVCNQLRQEALPICYGANIFTYSDAGMFFHADPGDVGAWLSLFDPAALEHLRRLDVWKGSLRLHDCPGFWCPSMCTAQLKLTVDGGEYGVEIIITKNNMCAKCPTDVKAKAVLDLLRNFAEAEEVIETLMAKRGVSERDGGPKIVCWQRL